MAEPRVQSPPLCRLFGRDDIKATAFSGKVDESLRSDFQVGPAEDPSQDSRR
jgi:hypothetical protein